LAAVGGVTDQLTAFALLETETVTVSPTATLVEEAVSEVMATSEAFCLQATKAPMGNTKHRMNFFIPGFLI
jgi:hypothetical protein